jgi:hypothetical protein
MAINEENVKISEISEQKPKADTPEFIKQARDEYKLKDGAATDLLVGVVKKNKDHYDSNGGMNQAFTKAGQTVPREIYEKIKEINTISEKTPEDKARRSDLYARLESWKRDRLVDKSKVRLIVDAVNSDLINHELMNPEYKVLLSQLVNKDGDLNEKGINLFYRKTDDKLMVQYTKDRMDKENAYDQKMQGIQVEENPNIESEVIGFEELMDGVHYKELEAESGVYDIITGQANEALAMDKNTGKFQIANWDGGVNSGQARVKKALTPIIKGGNVIADLSTRDIFGKGSTYRDDLSGLVANMDLEKMGLIDRGKPGFEDDLAKNELLKEEIIARLINPQNANDQKFAEENMIDYFTLLAGQTFNNKRNEVTPKQPEAKSITSGMTAEEIIKKFS